MNKEEVKKSLSLNLQTLDVLKGKQERLKFEKDGGPVSLKKIEAEIQRLHSTIYAQQQYLEDSRSAFLEFTYRDEKSEDGYFNMVVDYELVIPLRTMDGRNNKEDGSVNDAPGWNRILLGQTRVGGASPIRDGKVGTPFRDGAHALWDSMALNGLEIWSRYGEVRTLVKAAGEFVLNAE